MARGRRSTAPQRRWNSRQNRPWPGAAAGGLTIRAKSEIPDDFELISRADQRRNRFKNTIKLCSNAQLAIVPKGIWRLARGRRSTAPQRRWNSGKGRPGVVPHTGRSRREHGRTSVSTPQTRSLWYRTPGMGIGRVAEHQDTAQSGHFLIFKPDALLSLSSFGGWKCSSNFLSTVAHPSKTLTTLFYRHHCPRS